MKLATKVRNRAVAAFSGAYDRLLGAFPRADLSEFLRSKERSAALSYDQSARLERLVDEPIHYLDVGARSGPPRLVSHYSRFIAATLVEPEPVEAERLRRLGYHVIEKALGAERGTMTLNVTTQPGASSVFRPNPLIDHYLENPRERAMNWTFEERRKVVRTENVEVITIADLCADIGRRFDWIKLDAQGAEFQIIEGFGDCQPLFVTTEVSMVQFYESQRTFYDVAKVLYDRGYIMYSFEVSGRRPGSYAAHQPTLPGLPLHGDVCFMPDWSREVGRAMILERGREFAGLSLVLGLEEVLRYVLSVLSPTNADTINDALGLPIGGRFVADGFSSPT